MKYAFNDLLFRFLDGAMFGAFADHGLDLFFRDLVIAGLDIKYGCYEMGRFCEQ